jgi:hypothetical protein
MLPISVKFICDFGLFVGHICFPWKSCAYDNAPTRHHTTSQQKDHTLMDETKITLQTIIDITICSTSQQKDHKLTNGTKNTPKMIIGRMEVGAA